MKCKVDFRDFQEGIKKVERAIKRSSTMPVLENIFLTVTDNTLQLTATDTETTISYTLPAEVDATGQTMLDAITVKLLKKIKTNTVTITDNKIITPKKEIKFNPADPGIFPQTNITDLQKVLTIPEQDLKELLKIQYAAMKKFEHRPMFYSIVFDSNKIIACDAVRLAMRELPRDTGLNKAIIKLDGIKKLDKILEKRGKENFDVYITADKRYMVFKTDQLEVICQTLEMNYVDYKNVLPKHEKSIIINRKQFLEELKFALDVTKENKNNTIFGNITGNTFYLVAKNINNCIKTKINIDNPGNHALQFGFNCQFMIDVLNNYEGNTITIEFGSPVQPFVIREEGKLDLILPIKFPEDVLRSYLVA